MCVCVCVEVHAYLAQDFFFVRAHFEALSMRNAKLVEDQDRHRHRETADEDRRLVHFTQGIFLGI